MKIPLHYSLDVAMKVVNKINLPKEIAKNCDIQSWSNGREQGVCIHSTNGNYETWSKIAIAQQRNSDSIMVISGRDVNFNIQTNMPDDEAWEKRKHFEYNEVKKAAEYITKIITNKD